MSFDPRIETEAEQQPYPLLFMTVSGSHLYGFSSPDSDYDLRGSHILPLREAVDLNDGHRQETLEVTVVRAGLEIDIVTHDLKKYFLMITKRNGYVLEQIFSPLVVRTSPAHQELKEIARLCVTSNHSHHYLGMASTQWKLYEKEEPHRIKPLLYVFRGLLTGLHLMQTGEVEANLQTLCEVFGLPYIAELIALKQGGPEKGTLPAGDYQWYEAEYKRLVTTLEEKGRNSSLRAVSDPAAVNRLNELLLALRLG